MHQATLPEWLVLIAPPILGDGVLHVLVGEMVFQFHRHDGQAIEQDGDIRRLVGRFGGKMHLPYHGKAVAFITCLMFLVATGRRAEKGQLQVDAAERHAIPQNFQRATFLNQTRHMRCSSDLCALGVWKGGSNNLRRHNFHDKTSTVLDSS